MKKQQKIEEGTCDLGLLNDGTIVIQFGKLVKHMVFTPQQAKMLGLGLIENAVRGESLQRVSPPGQTAHGSGRVQ
jgi:hypothetical protein